MTRSGPLTDQNAPAASETDASRLSKKPRLDDEQSSNQEQQVVPCERPPPQEDTRLLVVERQLVRSVSRTLEEAAQQLAEFCDDDDEDLRLVLSDVYDVAQSVLERLVVVGRAADAGVLLISNSGDELVPLESAPQQTVNSLSHAGTRRRSNLTLCVARHVEGAAWSLDEFCADDDAFRAVWREMSDDAQDVIARLVAAGSVDDRAIVALEATSEEEKPVGAKDEAVEVTEPDDDEKQAAAGWLSKPKTVDATVAEAVATLAKINAPKKKQNEDALEALPALEKKVKDKTISTKDCSEFCKKWDLPLQGGKILKIPGKLRTLLEEEEKEMVGQCELEGEKTVLNKKLDLEMEAFDALPDDEKEGVTIRVAKNT